MVVLLRSPWAEGQIWGVGGHEESLFEGMSAESMHHWITVSCHQYGLFYASASDPLLNVSKAFDDVRSKLLCAVNTADTADPKELEDDTF